MSADHTWIGRPAVPDRDLMDEQDRTVRGVFLGPDAEEERTARGFFLAPADEDRTAVERALPTGYVGDPTEHAVFTADMVEELRRRLREAEAREGSGVRLRPTLDDDGDDPLADLEIDVELDDVAPSLDPIEAIATPLPSFEVALAPNSDSNFYAGFDDEHPDGVFLATYSRMPVGAPAYLDVHLPAGHRFRAAALVEWVRPPEASGPGLPAGVGFQMCGLDEPTRSLIRSFARHRKPLFYVG